VRELGNLIERVVALCPGQRIDLADLPPHIQNYTPDAVPDMTTLPAGRRRS
jgi:DNA-binding NtrC family response regulator